MARQFTQEDNKSELMLTRRATASA